jgi:hypothetical protein
VENLDMARISISLLVAFFVGTPLITKAADYIVPPGVTILTEEQVLKQLVGNSIVNETITEYWEPPVGDQKKGYFRAKRLGAKYGGSWEIKDGLFCYNFDKGLYDIYDGSCYTFSFDGVNLFFYNPDGSMWYPSGGRWKIVSGNPENL